mmetsp:Transcript_46381/g.72616  ORF Transcript_46381/g.72616 Transcript_46381/m.72616 type:complete len:99 (+) Transcript_46381:182-478(+)
MVLFPCWRSSPRKFRIQPSPFARTATRFLLCLLGFNLVEIKQNILQVHTSPIVVAEPEVQRPSIRMLFGSCNRSGALVSPAAVSLAAVTGQPGNARLY